jgi:hypothetical protein
VTDPDAWREDTFGPLDERIADCMTEGMSEREIAQELGLSIAEAKARIDGACRRLGLTKNERDPYEGFGRRRRSRPVEQPRGGLRSRAGVAVGVFGVTAIALVLAIRLWPSGGGDGATVTVVSDLASPASVSAIVPPTMPPYALMPRQTAPAPDVYYSTHAYGGSPLFAAPLDPFSLWMQAMLLEETSSMRSPPR